MNRTALILAVLLSVAVFAAAPAGAHLLPGFAKPLPLKIKPKVAPNVYFDEDTGLMWEKNDNGQKMRWREGKQYCRNLMLSDFDDWRLPSIKDLKSIVDKSRRPAIKEGLNPREDAYWSSNSFMDNRRMAHTLDFRKGFTKEDDKGFSHYVRCVRSRSQVK